MTRWERAAIEWWEARRPAGFTEAMHVETPMVGLDSPSSRVLATAVAALVRSTWHRPDLPRDAVMGVPDSDEGGL
jgi:hypothetical protein